MKTSSSFVFLPVMVSSFTSRTSIGGSSTTTAPRDGADALRALVAAGGAVARPVSVAGAPGVGVLPATGVPSGTAGVAAAWAVSPTGTGGGAGGNVVAGSAAPDVCGAGGSARRERDQSAPATPSTTTAAATPAIRPIEPRFGSGEVVGTGAADAGTEAAAGTTGIGTETGTMGAVAVDGGVCVAIVGNDDRSETSSVSVGGRSVDTGVPAIVGAIADGSMGVDALEVVADVSDDGVWASRSRDPVGTARGGVEISPVGADEV